MALVDPSNGRFLRVNPAGCAMLGYEEGELLELTIQDVTAPADREESIARFRSVVTGEVATSAAKLHYLRRDGSMAYGVVSTALARDPDGRPLHLVANVVDITEQVEAQDRLQSLLESKNQLIASVSHELRTPLTAVLGFAELLRGDVETLTSTEQVELIESIAGQTSDLANIVEDLLVAARADNETLNVARVSVDLRAQSAQVLEALSQHAGRGNITFDAQVVRGWGDPARVRQIMRNLITNAFRYGGRNIVVSTYVKDSEACVAVADDGTGIPEEDRERIFEPYERSPGSKGLTASIGLGLTVSRKLANLMKGDLTYRYEDGISVFELALPLVES
jgi:PAS domain S-box-containing protein